MTISRKVFSEEGGQFLVDVLSDAMNGEMREVRLRCVRTLRPSPGCVVSDGEEFEVSASKGFEHYCGWSLEDICCFAPETFLAGAAQ